jgi:holo-[acyl-carrier protein] synthase
MVIGIGVDIVEIKRIAQALETTMIERVFTEVEIQYCTRRKNRFQHFAGRFAAKEAALKALGTGWQKGIRWKDVEVTSNPLGKPEVLFHRRAREIYQESGTQQAHVTITHATEYAVAVVVLES